MCCAASLHLYNPSTEWEFAEGVYMRIVWCWDVHVYIEVERGRER